MGGTINQLVTAVCLARIRTTLEFAAPVFSSSLTQEQSKKIEMVPKKALAIVLGKNYQNYELALSQTGLERLDARRVSLCLKFAKKCTESQRHMSMFPKNPNFREDMRNPKPYKEYQCKTSRYFNSPLPYLARLLNQNYKK